MTSATVEDPSTAVEVPEVSFAAGLPGFPGPRRFAFLSWGELDSPYSVMVDVDSPVVRFLVIPPQVFFPDYVVDLSDADAAALHLEDPDDCLVLVIVTLGSRAEDATANLLGPVVINVRTLEGLQTVLAESGHSARTRLRP